VFVSISDTGKGMSEEVKRKIFDPFFTTRRPQSTGLGMSIAYSVMERHDGRIEVESELGKATTITLCIPANKGIKQQKLSSRPARGLMVKGLNILVVDDKKEICNILDKFFSDVGHTVKTVNNGTEAIELAKREDYDLVLCDLLMIDVTGYAIKALNDLDKVPKIGMLTDCDVNLTSAEKNALTVDFIINKPLKLLELANHVNALFNDI
jgi:CheY-like chemotaxis protein